MKTGYLFTSSRFEVEPGEDADTNPRRYGRQLARWIKEQFEGLGYEVEEVIPEDWGWCVVCQRAPFSLWIGCGNRDDSSTAEAGDPPPKASEILWHCFSVAEVPLLRRLFKWTDTSSALDKLDSELEQILTNDPAIKISDEL
jgi:hypothetical protein